MRALVALVGVSVMGGFTVAADEKIDAKKLVGKWQLAKPDAKGPMMVLEIMDKGRLTLAVTLNEKTERVDGTYKLDGNKLEVELSVAGMATKETLTITKLTDDEMVTKDSKGMEEAMKRVKEK